MIDHENKIVTCPTCGNSQTFEDAAFPFCEECKSLHYGCSSCGDIHTLFCDDAIKVLMQMDAAFSMQAINIMLSSPL